MMLLAASSSPAPEGVQKKIATAATGDILSPPGQQNGSSGSGGGVDKCSPAEAGATRMDRNNRAIPGPASRGFPRD